MKFSKAFFRTTVVRLSLIYVGVFALATSALFATVYLLTVRVIDAETDSVIQAELQGLSEQYSRLGLTGLAAVIRDRSLGTAGSRSVYLLADFNFQPIVGNLTSWPRVAEGVTGRVGKWFEFDMQVRVAENVENHRVRAALIILQGGYRLLVGTDIVERERFERLMARVGMWAVAWVIAVGSLIGVIMNRRLLKQVNSISVAGQHIANGDFSRRLPVSGSGDELDELASGLNTLLTRIEQLTLALRFVIDGTAHDLRAPLNRLRTRVEQALAQAEAGERERLEVVQSDTDAVLRTLDSLLRIAQAQGGGAELAALSVGSLAREMAELYEPLAQERGLHLRLGALDRGMIHGSRQLLAHALANLLDNAMKYTAPGGEVSVSVSEGAETVDLRLADSGPGIPAAERSRVLERFVRLETAQGELGSGLGLSLVVAVCRLHHASLALAEARPGDALHPGLAVTLRLPRLEAGAPKNKESR